MNRVTLIILAGIIAVGTVACCPATAPHSQPVRQANEWQVPSSVATVQLVPMDNIAPDKSYGTAEDIPPVTVPVTEPPVAIPAYVAPVYAAPKPVSVQGTPVVVGTEVKPVVKTQTPVAVPSVPVGKPTPSATCPPLLHKDGVNITPPNAPSTCVYAQ